MTSRFGDVVPLIPAGVNLSEALAFYVNHMHFSVAWQGDKMAGIERDNVAFNLIENVNEAWAQNASFSVGVTELEALHREYRDMPASVGPLELKPWGPA
jgi:hypothetical protein